MITSIRVGNFKGFGNAQTIPFAPITLFVGPNSGGKSTAIQSLVLLNEALRSNQFNIFKTQLGGNAIDLGGFRQYVFRRDVSRQVEIGATFPASELEDESRATLSGAAAINISLIFGIRADSLGEVAPGAAVTLTAFELSVDGAPLLKLSARADGFMRIDSFNVVSGVGRNILGAIVEANTTSTIASGEDVRTITDAVDNVIANARISISGLLPAMELAPSDAVASEHVFAVSRATRAEDFTLAVEFVLPRLLNILLRNTCKAFAAQVEGMQYLGPLRAFPSRHFAFEDQSDSNWNAGGGFAWQRVREDPVIRELVNKWLSSEFLQTPYELIVRRLVALDDSYLPAWRALRDASKRPIEDDDQFPEEIDIEAISQSFMQNLERDTSIASVDDLVLRDRRTDTMVSHRDVGIGISQVLPVLVNAFADNSVLTAIEQPELHLHPGLQAELGDIFVRSIKTSPSTQFVLETHSEHLILRLLRRIRESSDGTQTDLGLFLDPKQVSVIFMSPGKDGTEAISLPITPDGEFEDPWPGGFFAERSKELF